MKKFGALLLMLQALSTYAQGNQAQESIAGLLERTQGQILSLTRAFDDSQMAWRPAEGIRSTGETVMHVAAANYYLAMKLGFPPPEGVDIMSLESVSGKEAILEAYQKSADFVREKVMAEDSGRLGEEVDLGFARMSRLSALLMVLEHTGEHKGQLIAYARSNGVAPPWSE